MNVSILFVVQGIYIKILSLFKKSGRLKWAEIKNDNFYKDHPILWFLEHLM